MRTIATVALLFAAVVVQASSSGPTDNTQLFNGTSCTSDSQCPNMGVNTATGDPGFVACCAYVNFYNGTVHSVNNVRMCFPRYIADDSYVNGKLTNLTIGSYLVSA